MYCHATLRRTRVALAALALVGLLAAACGSDADDTESSSATASTEAPVAITGVPGVSDTEIRFAALGTITGNPTGACTLACFADGINAYFAYRNDEGGLFGRNLVLAETLDDELGKNKERALEIVSSDDIFAAFASPVLANGWADLAKARIPLFAWNIVAAEAAADTIFTNNGVVCRTCLQRDVPYVVKLEGAKKVATLGYGVSSSSKTCAESYARSIDHYSDDIGGAKAVYTNAELAFGLPNGVGPEVTAMKNAGVDFIFGCLDLNGMKAVAQELARQDFQVPLLHRSSYDAEFIRQGGTLFEGNYVEAHFRPFEATTAGTSLGAFKKWMEESGKEQTEPAMYGWIAADMAYTGIKLAGQPFDREKVIEALNTKATDYTAGGLIPPLDFGNNHLPPTETDLTHALEYECNVFLKVTGGEMEIVGGTKEKPFVCFPGDSTEWTEPTLRNFE
jgi:hypothetical protein